MKTLRFAAFALAAMFAGHASAASTVRFGQQVLSVGDTEGKVYQVAGQPTRTRPIESDHGGYQGDRLDYDTGAKTVQVFVRDGRVTRIEEINN
ncbi:hypothetical protein FHW69_002685 [Luteibacter sp. Sphag1AF]|uniref:DUF2845 domain-containing protein n=1 Tax=Luteibacter sp. Sphag1AF TaxID=2587031 RepID=UPI00160D80D0|nr:DUF2845 domain-containing protein [Luteibacter sp. Sphag1AF]MBB3228050.1 hypothetical protein [Luteibacter sp. Sphag1AF]